MLEKAATCPAETCSKRRHQVLLQHAQTGGNISGYNMFEQAAKSYCILILLQLASFMVSSMGDKA
jgi:hypothetical protein